MKALIATLAVFAAVIASALTATGTVTAGRPVPATTITTTDGGDTLAFSRDKLTDPIGSRTSPANPPTRPNPRG